MNPFVLVVCVPDQASSAPGLFHALPNFTTVTVISLQYSEIMISFQGCHRQIAKRRGTFLGANTCVIF